MLQLRFQLVFIHTRSTAAHGALVGTRGNLSRPAQQAQLGGTFIQAQFMQHMIQICKISRGSSATRCLAPNTVHPFHYLAIEVGTAAHRVINPLPALYQAGQNVIDVANGEGVIGSVVFTYPLRSGPIAVP